MKQLASLLLVSAVLVGFAVAPPDAAGCGYCHGVGVGYGVASFGCTPDGCPPYWCDPYACLQPWPFDNPLIVGPRNWSWLYPDGGFTVYPGEPGSGVRTGSDYSHVNWVQPPQANAQAVLQKLDALGIPRVPQDTTYLGKNPAQVDKAKLPVPKAWQPPPAEKEKDKAIEKEKEADSK
jgi:hypothetical protein